MKIHPDSLPLAKLGDISFSSVLATNDESMCVPFSIYTKVI